MISRAPALATLIAFTTLAGSCNFMNSDSLGVIIQTRLAFVNFSKTRYVAFGIREHPAPGSEPGEFQFTPLLAPGAIYRVNFNDLIGVGCPEQIDLRVFAYRRVNEDVPIGLDAGEMVEPLPEVTRQEDGVRVCPPADEPALESFTIVNWEAEAGVARVQLAQGSLLAAILEFQGTDSELAVMGQPPLAPTEPIRGRVVRRSDGSGVAGAGVILRSRFRVRLDSDPTNDPDAGYGDPIAFAETDANGDFSIDRPAGGYQLEFFSDEFDFRPPVMELETPIEIVRVIAEPITP